jgi:hypothetical protein
MGLVNEIIGGVVAEEALEHADPNANLIEKGLAFVGGAVGENAIQNELGGLFGGKKPEGEQADGDQPAADDQSNG